MPALNPVEVTGAIFGFICVVLTAKQNMWCWPTGIVSVVLYGIFYYQQTWYASMYLQIFYLVFCIIGWYQWVYGVEKNSKLVVSRTQKKHLWVLAAITISMFIIAGIILDKKTNDELPYFDAFVAAISFTAQWMMNNKLVENWILWIVSDVIYAVLHYQMNNVPSFIMYLVFVFSAIAGYYLWMKSLKSQQRSA